MKRLNYIRFPLIMGILGSIFSSRKWILFLNKQSPPVGLLFYYIIIFVAILLLQHIGLVIAEVPFDSISHAVGTLMVIFSFFIIFDWESYYITLITQPPGKKTEISNVYLQSEDGAVFYLWYNIAKLSIEQARVMTYIVTPIVLSFFGMLLIRGKPLRWSPI